MTDRFATDPKRQRRSTPAERSGQQELHKQFPTDRTDARYTESRAPPAYSLLSVSTGRTPSAAITLKPCRIRSPTARASDRRLQPVVALRTPKVQPTTAALRRTAAPCGYHNATRRSDRRVESDTQTLRSSPFPSKRFHVLLNSLFKVLFNFPSRYLFAIGLVVCI